MGLVAGCFASAALHGGVIAMVSLLDVSPALAGWRGSDPFGSDRDGEPPSFSIRVRAEDLAASAPTSAIAEPVAEAQPGSFEPFVSLHARIAVAPAMQSFDLSHRPEHDAPSPLPAPTATESAGASGAAPAPPQLELLPDVRETSLAGSLDAATSEETTTPSSSAPDDSDRASTGAVVAAEPVGVRAAVGNASAGSAADSRAGSALVREGAVGDNNRAGQIGDGAAGEASGTQPPPTFAPKPNYPLLSMRRGEEGKVHVRLSVARAGHVLSVEIVQSSGHARLDRAAVETLMRWRFAPLAIDDPRTAVRFLHCVTFRLQ